MVTMRWPRRRPKVIVLRCRKCGRKMQVVAGSAAARERQCNLCIIAEVNRQDATLLDIH